MDIQQAILDANAQMKKIKEMNELNEPILARTATQPAKSIFSSAPKLAERLDSWLAEREQLLVASAGATKAADDYVVAFMATMSVYEREQQEQGGSMFGPSLPRGLREDAAFRALACEAKRLDERIQWLSQMILTVLGNPSITR